MRVVNWLAALTFTLAGCEVVPTTTSPVPDTEIPTLAKEPAVSSQSPSARASARAFVQVLNQLEPVAEQECRDRSSGLNCDFLILVDDREGQPANAFQTIDDEGRPIIAFTLALIADMNNVDEIAFVMAHEAAHHIENHLEQQQSHAIRGAQVFGRLAGASGGGEDAIRAAQEIGASIGARTFSKDFELEADRLGTIIAARAGYDPVRGAEFFARVPDPGDRFLGTHPANADRVQVVLETAASL